MDSKLFVQCVLHLKNFYKDLHLEEPKTCLIHCDFRPANILQNAQGLFLIDYESTRTGDPGYDFIKMFESFGSDKTLWNTFCKSYSEIRDLPNLETIIPYYEFELNFGFLNWATTHNDDQLFNKRLNNVKKLLQR